MGNLTVALRYALMQPFLHNLENMPLSQQDRDWVNKQIKESEKRYAPPPPKVSTPEGPKKESWWKRNYQFVALSLIALAAWIQPLVIQHKAEDLKKDIQIEVSNQLKPFDDRLRSVEGDVNEMKGELKYLFRIAKEQQFSKLESAVAVAQRTKRPIDPSIVKQVKTSLEQMPSTAPDYWSSVLRFLTLASNGLSPNLPPADAMKNVHLSDVALINQHSFLDGKHVFVDGGSLENVEIHRSRITFTQNPVQLKNVTFVDCVFDMPDVSIPSNHLQQAARQLLLAQDLKSAQIFNLS
jgi:hypothetical protein